MKQLSWLLLLFSSISMASIPTDSWRLRYDERGLPLIDVQIVNRLHTLMLDTGSGESIHLHKYDLDKLIAHPSLNATQQAPRRLIDVSGGENKVSAWKFNRLLISNISFYDVEVVSFKPWGLSIGGGNLLMKCWGLDFFTIVGF